jgi:hypothetical protein
MNPLDMCGASNNKHQSSCLWNQMNFYLNSDGPAPLLVLFRSVLSGLTELLALDFSLILTALSLTLSMQYFVCLGIMSRLISPLIIDRF